MQSYKVGVAGANSLKGREIIRYFIKNNFPYSQLHALDLKKFDNKCLTIEKQKIYIKEIKENAIKDLDIIYFVMDGPIKNKYIDYLKQFDTTYIIDVDDEAKYPLLLKGFTKTTEGKIFSLPSSVSVAICLALLPLNEITPISKVVYTAMQSLSDLGTEAISELENQLLDYVNYRVMSANIVPLPHSKKHYPIALNIIPQTSDFNYETLQSKDEYYQGEEIKNLLDNEEMEVYNTTLRVPLVRTDVISLYVETKGSFEIFEYIDRLHGDANLIFLENVADAEYPMPLVTEGQDQVYIGRLRRVKENAIQLYIVCDNLVKGAAISAVDAAFMLLHE